MPEPVIPMNQYVIPDETVAQLISNMSAGVYMCVHVHMWEMSQRL